MALSDYTAFADVRAALGVSVKEISDETLGLGLYEDDLLVNLDALGASFLDDLAVVAAIDVNVQTRAEKNLLRLNRLFATYSVAKHLTSSLPLFSPQSITDGKAGLQRYTDGPYSKTIKQVQDMFTSYQAKLEEAYAGYTAATTTVVTARTFMAVSTGSPDPVTGV